MKLIDINYHYKLKINLGMYYTYSIPPGFEDIIWRQITSKLRLAMFEINMMGTRSLIANAYSK